MKRPVEGHLAAEGRTNRQIGQGLDLSLKTVETHLARVYSKLGVGGRAELSALLDQPAPCVSAGVPPPTAGG